MPCGGGFGSGSFGSGPFGSGSSLSVSIAEQESLNAVLVTFSVPPKADDSGDVTDALFAPNYALEARDPHDSTVRLSQWVEEVDADTVRVLFDGPLSAPAVYRIVVASRVVDVYGNPISSTCRTFDFGTTPPTRLPPQAATPTEDPTDLNNPFLPKDASDPSDAALGTYQITDQGDYALERARAYLRKRILRRATTQAGEFFHLPDYGFAEPLKGTITPDLLRRLQTKAQAQIRQEPDVESVRVTASLAAGSTSIVVLDISVSDRYGRTEELTVPLRFRSVD